MNHILKSYGHKEHAQIKNAIIWNYFQDDTRSTSHLLNCLINFYSEIIFELPFFKSIEYLVKNDTDENYFEERKGKRNLFTYVFHHSNSVDLKGNINLFNGAAHTSELPFLFGPTLFKQVTRRRLTTTEDKLCKKLHTLFGDFIKYG
jgi:hypothetical protein